MVSPREITGLLIACEQLQAIGPLQDPVTWYGINYAGTQMTQWDFQNKGTRTSPARLSFVLEVPLRHLRPSVIYSVPCDRILQRAYSSCTTTLRVLHNLQLLPALRVRIGVCSKAILLIDLFLSVNFLPQGSSKLGHAWSD